MLRAEAERANAAGAVGRPAETVALTLWSAAHGVAVLRVEDPHDQHGFDAKTSAAVLSAVVASL